MNELFLCRATQSRYLKQLANAILKYSPQLTCTIRIAHMEGEEFFGFCKQKANLAPKLEGDSHKHDHVNFSHLRVNRIIARSSVEMNNLGQTKFYKILKCLRLHVEI
jgi:hypothetical protein